ncbi:MAG: DUF4115 domain-containing protein [Alphaproteobacteria bacterium]|mgnify:CR=1 FL=1|jgi:cytoskeleton protein RodZ|nr:DUF4115 domain-containing protein [Alphaproteobacteria bacterium]
MAMPDDVMINDQEPRGDHGYQGIGAQLRYAREQVGSSLEDVARALRIRYPHLLAIEEGRFEDLPGPAYVVGFMRSYAEQVGIDPGIAVDRFRDEVSGFRPEQNLRFPEPPPEARTPQPWIIGAGLVLAVIAFGTWYFLQTRDSLDLVGVVEVPAEMERIAPVRPRPPPPQVVAPDIAGNTGAGAESGSELDSAATMAELASEPAPAIELENAAPSTGSESVVTAVVETPEPAVEDVGSVAERQPSAEPEPELTPLSETVVEAIAGEDPAPAGAEAITGALTDAPDAPTLVANPPPPPAAPNDSYEPRVYGQDNAGARVVLRALSDSWVQVQGGNNELLLTRILYAGDTYLVPNRDDLILITGNAGGIEILVDGKLMPELGPEGAVRRNVSLSPDVLAGGATSDR